MSICSCPSLPERSEPDQAGAAAQYMGDMSELTAGIGPTMLVKALSNIVDDVTLFKIQPDHIKDKYFLI